MRCKARGLPAPGLARRFAVSSARRARRGALLGSVAEALERVLGETDAARAKIEEALAATAFEPKDLERAEERLFALRALARKHRVERGRSAGARRSPRSRASSRSIRVRRGLRSLPPAPKPRATPMRCGLGSERSAHSGGRAARCRGRCRASAAETRQGAADHQDRNVQRR